MKKLLKIIVWVAIVILLLVLLNSINNANVGRQLQNEMQAVSESAQ